MVHSRNDIGKAGILDPFQPTLNECLWQNDKLRPEIREQILEVAQEIADITNVQIEGLLMYGGAAGYQYSDESDIDVSVYPKHTSELAANYKEVLNIFRGRIEKVCGMELHFFLKDESQTELREASEAVYDILNDSWVTKPVKEEFNPYEEWADKIMQAQKIEGMLEVELKYLTSYLRTIENMDTAVPVLEKFVSIIDILRKIRSDEHIELRQKAVKEDITVKDRATQNEITWKYLDQAGLLKKLDFIKKALENSEEQEMLPVTMDQPIKPIYKSLY